MSESQTAKIISKLFYDIAGHGKPIGPSNQISPESLLAFVIACFEEFGYTKSMSAEESKDVCNHIMEKAL
jgi:hypothetical protein